MQFDNIKSYAKVNLSLNITGKNSTLHKIESIIAFIDLYDVIKIKKIKSDNHLISFSGKFSKKIGKNNTVSKLMNILEKKKYLEKIKFKIEIKKNIPSQAGLGGGSMNAANILKYLVKKKIIRINKKDLVNVAKLIGSDVVLGLKSSCCLLTSKNKVKYFNKYQKTHILVVKPVFGCSTKDIYSKVKKFNKPKLKQPKKMMLDLSYLKTMGNSLEAIVFSKYPKLKNIKLYLENLRDTEFVRMTGSGSALIAYFRSKKRCEIAKKEFVKKYKNYWCIASKTI